MTQSNIDYKIQKYKAKLAQYNNFKNMKGGDKPIPKFKIGDEVQIIKSKETFVIDEIKTLYQIEYMGYANVYSDSIEKTQNGYPRINERVYTKNPIPDIKITSGIIEDIVHLYYGKNGEICVKENEIQSVLFRTHILHPYQKLIEQTQKRKQTQTQENKEQDKKRLELSKKNYDIDVINIKNAGFVVYDGYVNINDFYDGEIVRLNKRLEIPDNLKDYIGKSGIVISSLSENNSTIYKIKFENMKYSEYVSVDEQFLESASIILSSPYELRSIDSRKGNYPGITFYIIQESQYKNHNSK